MSRFSPEVLWNVMSAYRRLETPVSAARYIRRALYMPALVAIRCEPNVRAFYEKLVARGKRPIVAVVAVMRKLLHSIYGMFKHREPFDGDKFYRPAMLQP
jgi:hypothetical protein